MTQPQRLRSKAMARDAALRLVHRLTTGVTFAAVLGLGLFGYAAELTHPGTAGTATSTAMVATSATTTTTTANLSSGSASTTSSSGVAVSGGS